MGDAGCISYTFPLLNLPHFLSALLALSSAARLYLRMPVCKSLLRGYNNPWERFCWLTSVKGHCSPRIKLDQPEALVEEWLITSSPLERMFCRHSSRGEAARLGAVCQPPSCSASLIMHHQGKSDSAQPSLFLVRGWAQWGGREIPRGRRLGSHSSVCIFTSSYSESSDYPHWEGCRTGSSYWLGIKCPSTFAIGSRSKIRKEKNWLLSESQLPPLPSNTSRDQNQAILYF